ncbi:MAG: YkgJ family cysteine cluster protein [Candidatus Bathyarchaeota archaeon]|nr:YkgJ family cysteine cluster protein [Candidatus Bathyarchaeota archaeon]
MKACRVLEMLFAPWQFIANWECRACGLCCKAYSVVLSFQEWLSIVKNYGVETTASDLSKLYLRKKSDGSCVFLYKFSDMHLCGLQHMKPTACKLWPFKVLTSPKFGYAREALYTFNGNKLYIYADSNCKGLVYGKPTWTFATQTLREFVEIAIGIRREQLKTTANIGIQPYPNFEALNIRRFRLF